MSVSIRWIASNTGLSRSRIQQLIAEGTLPAVRVDRRVLVPREAFDEWFASLPPYKAADARRFAAEHPDPRDGDDAPPLTPQAAELLRSTGFPATPAPDKAKAS